MQKTGRRRKQEGFVLCFDGRSLRRRAHTTWNHFYVAVHPNARGYRRLFDDPIPLFFHGKCRFIVTEDNTDQSWSYSTSFIKFLSGEKKHPAELNPLLKQLFKGLRFDIQQPRRIKKAYSIYPFISPKTAAIHFCTSTLTFLIVFVFLPHFTRTHRVLSGGPKTM